jgi:hypothetical protein
MAAGERDGGGAGKPGADGADGAAAAASDPDEGTLEISSRGRIVVRSSSHPPGDKTPYSEPPDSTPPAARAKRDTPAERPRGRRAARAVETGSTEPDAFAFYSSTSARGTAVLWAIIVALSAALAYALLR